MITPHPATQRSVNTWPPTRYKWNCSKVTSSKVGLQFVFPSNRSIWVFPKIMIPRNGWLIVENPIKIDDLGGVSPYFWKHPYFGISPIHQYCFISVRLRDPNFKPSLGWVFSHSKSYLFFPLVFMVSFSRFMSIVFGSMVVIAL